MPKAGSASAPEASIPTASSNPFDAAARGQLGRDRRVRKSGDFAAILKGGSRGSTPLLGVAILSAQGPGRIGISASTRVGGAVARNRARRLVKECYRRDFKRSAPYDIVVNIDPRFGDATATDVRQALNAALSKAVSHRGGAGRRHRSGN